MKAAHGLTDYQCGACDLHEPQSSSRSRRTASHCSILVAFVGGDRVVLFFGFLDSHLLQAMRRLNASVAVGGVWEARPWAAIRKFPAPRREVMPLTANLGGHASDARSIFMSCKSAAGNRLQKRSRRNGAQTSLTPARDKPSPI